MILQSRMDILKGELGSSSQTCVSSTVDGNVIGLEAERISSMTEEEDQVPRTIPVIKTEPEVSGVPLVSVRMFHTGFWAVSKKRNVSFLTHCMLSTTCNAMFHPAISLTFFHLYGCEM